jgi:hypothetical protein
MPSKPMAHASFRPIVAHLPQSDHHILPVSSTMEPNFPLRIWCRADHYGRRWGRISLAHQGSRYCMIYFAWQFWRWLYDRFPARYPSTTLAHCLAYCYHFQTSFVTFCQTDITRIAVDSSFTNMRTYNTNPNKGGSYTISANHSSEDES